MAFDALFEYVRGGASDVTRVLVAQLDDLGPVDQAYVIEDFISLAAAGTRSDRVDAGTHRLAELTAGFIADHRDQLNVYMENVAVQEELLYLADSFRTDNGERSRAIRDAVTAGF